MSSPSPARKLWAASRSRMRSPTAWAPSPPVSGRISANSSPPKRDTTSVSRALPRITAAASTSARLPARWPWVSLIDLKPSRSMNSSDSGRPLRETKRASRSGRPLSLLFIDLDGFKSINDTHGHLAGSRALVEAAAVIRGSARETDVVSRFGGDEFALILPDTGGDGAHAVGERIRERLAAHSFLAGDGLDIH